MPLEQKLAPSFSFIFAQKLKLSGRFLAVLGNLGVQSYEHLSLEEGVSLIKSDAASGTNNWL